MKSIVLYLKAVLPKTLDTKDRAQITNLLNHAQVNYEGADQELQFICSDIFEDSPSEHMQIVLNWVELLLRDESVIHDMHRLGLV